MKLKLEKILLESLLTEKDNRRILIDKEGVSEEIANWAHELSDKLSIWIVKSLKDKYARANANLNNKISLDDYYRTLDGDYRNIVGMMKKQNRPQTNLNTLTFDEATDLVGKYNYIENWLDAPESNAVAEFGPTFLQNKSWNEAVEMADEWHQSLTAGGQLEDLLDEKDEIFHTFPDGFMWVLRKEHKCDKSSKSMGHCGTASNSNMYLLRLVKDGSEYVTVDWDPNEKFIQQVKGLKNKKPIPKYYPYLIWLIRDWGGIEKLKNEKGYLPHTNFHLGELDPDIAAEIVGEKPNIIDINTLLQFTPTQNKSKLISNLFKYDSFINKLIPYGFADFFNMVENKTMVINAVLNNPTFLEKMNKYPKVLTDTLERLIDGTDRKDLLINTLLKRNGLIEMLDDEGANVLIRNHSDPDEIRDIILQSEFSSDDEDEEGMYESINLKEFIVKRLRKNLIK